MSSLRIGTPSRVTELRRPDTVAWVANPPNATNFSEALDSATNAPAGAQPPQGDRGKPSAEGRSTAAAALVSLPASVSAETAAAENAPKRVGVNAKSAGRDSTRSLGEPAALLDPARPQGTLLSQAAAQRGGTAPPPAHSCDQGTSQSRREPSGQELERHASLSATGSASDPVERSPEQNTRISLIAIPVSRNPSDFACELFDNGEEHIPVGLQTAQEPTTTRSDGAPLNPKTAPAATADEHQFDRKRPAEQTGAIDTVLGLMSAMPLPALPDSDNISLPSADQGDDRRLDHLGVGLTSGSERRGGAGVARLADDTSNLSASNEPNADPAPRQAATQPEQAIDVPTGLALGSVAASHGHASSASAATVTPVAEHPITTMASSDSLVVAMSPAQSSVIAAFDPSIANAAAVAGAASNTAAGGLSAENSPSASAATALPVNLPDQLLSSVIGSIQSPGREIVLRLDPPDLGTLTVRVLVSGHEVAAWFATPQVQLQQAIGQAIGQLHTDLGNAGYTLSAAWVGADASNPRDRGASLPLPARERLAATGVEPETPPAAEIVSSSSGVSIYV